MQDLPLFQVQAIVDVQATGDKVDHQADHPGRRSIPQNGLTLPHNSEPANTFDAKTVDRLLAVTTTEYQQLKQEISQRSVAQSTLVAAAPTVGGLAITIGVATNQDLLLSILVPVLAISFGQLWLDHASQIERVARYIQRNLEPTLQGLGNSKNVMHWERASRKSVEKASSRWTAVYARMALPILFVFVAPALVATGKAIFSLISASEVTPDSSSVLPWTVIATGATLEFAFGFFWWGTMRSITATRGDAADTEVDSDPADADQS